MAWKWLLVLSPLIALVVNVMATMLTGFKYSTMRSVVVGLCCGLWFDLLMNASDGVWISVFTYLALSFCFFAYLNLNLTSIRIRIIREILPYPAGTSIHALGYTPDEAFMRRLTRLQAAGHINKVDGRWYLQARKFLPFVVISGFLRRLIIKNR